MPLPQPIKDEKQKEFVDRFMADADMVREYPDEKQRYAVALAQWEKSGEKAFAGFEDWIEIFKGGKQTDSSGREHNGDVLIDKALATFNPAEIEPPAVIGHPADNAPAFGWVEGLKAVVRDGVKVLLAKFKQVVPEFETAVKAGRYKKRSAAFYSDGRLRHVGFLGAAIPAVKGLADVAFKEKAGPVFEFEEHQNQGGAKMTFKEFLEALQFWKQTEEGNPPNPPLTKGGKTGARSEENSGRGDFTEADMERIRKEAEEAGQKKARAEFAEKARQDTKTARDREIAAFCEQGVKAGKLPPAWVESGLVNFMQNLDADNEIAFSEGQKKSPLEWFKGFLGSFSASPLFKEMAIKNKNGSEFSEAETQQKLGESIAAKVNK